MQFGVGSATSVFGHLAKQGKSRWEAIGGLVPLFVWATLCVMWRLVSPELWERYPIAAQTAAGLCIGEVTVRLQPIRSNAPEAHHMLTSTSLAQSRLITAHLTRQPVARFPRPLLLFALTVALSRALPWFYAEYVGLTAG